MAKSPKTSKPEIAPEQPPEKPVPRKLSDAEIARVEDQVDDPSFTEPDEPVEVRPTPMAEEPIPEDVEFGNEDEAEEMAKAPPPAVESSRIPRPASPDAGHRSMTARAKPEPFRFPNRKDRRLQPGKMKPITAVYRHWCVRVPAGTQPEDVMDPIYFGHYLKGANFTLQALDKIEVIPLDMAWEGNFRVLFVGEAEVSISPVGEISLHDTQSTEHGDEYDVVQAGDQIQIIHKATRAIVKSGFRTRPEAYRFLADHVQALTR